MPITTILFGLVMIPIGGIIFEITGREHYTALIPTFLGGLFILLGFLGYNWPSLRKHVMHLAAALGLLGGIGTAWRAIPGLLNLAQGIPVKSVPALLGTSLTGLLCFTFVGLCVRSFIEARRIQKINREQASKS